MYENVKNEYREFDHSGTLMVGYVSQPSIPGSE